MEIILLLILSVLPVILIGLYIYKKDPDKEPKKLLGQLFFGGVVSVIVVLIISGIIEVIIPEFAKDVGEFGQLGRFVYAMLGVALVEEVSKFIFVYKIVYKSKHFNNIYDMAVYSMFVALGFACIENIMYVIGTGFITGIARAFTAVPGHAVDGLFMGYYLSLARINTVNGNRKKAKRNLALSIIVPTLTHGFYDYFLMSEIPILILACLVLLITTLVIGLKRINKLSKITNNFIHNSNFCPQCGTPVTSTICPVCGNTNE